MIVQLKHDRHYYKSGNDLLLLNTANGQTTVHSFCCWVECVCQVVDKIYTFETLRSLHLPFTTSGTAIEPYVEEAAIKFKIGETKNGFWLTNVKFCVPTEEVVSLRMFTSVDIVQYMHMPRRSR